jgi:hypothetical protein
MPANRSVVVLCTALLAMVQTTVIPAGEAADLERVLSEVVYVPAYSRIDTTERTAQSLASTLVIHNVDPEVAIELTSVHYHNQDGELLREFLSDPQTLQPFQSSHFLTQISETEGGIGANYIVEWEAQEGALSPVVEAVMIGGSGTLGISFASRGRVISRDTMGAMD